MSTVVPVGRGRVLADQVAGSAVATQHEPGQCGLVERGDGDTRLHDPAVAQRRDAVGERQDLLEVVADEQHRRSLVGDEADHLVERRQGLVGDGPGGLVEDDDAAAGLAVLQRPGHGHRDALARGQGGDGRLGVDRDAEELEGPAHCRAVGGLVDAAGEPPDRVAADADVLADAQVGHEAEVLVDEGESLSVQASRVHRGAEVDAVDEDLPAVVGAVDAADELDQRGLAGPVLPDQRVDLARAPG